MNLQTTIRWKTTALLIGCAVALLGCASVPTANGDPQFELDNGTDMNRPINVDSLIAAEFNGSEPMTTSLRLTPNKRRLSLWKQLTT